jgi:hypothetical protein
MTYSLVSALPIGVPKIKHTTYLWDFDDDDDYFKTKITKRVEDEPYYDAKIVQEYSKLYGYTML